MRKWKMKKYIPWGMYCYKFLGEIKDENGHLIRLKTKTCPWYKYIETVKLHRDTGCEHKNSCSSQCWSSPETSCKLKIVKCEYLKFIDHNEETLLWDRCKECGEHDNLS